ncbi:protein phosphatase 2C domain-containing protein [Streptomyces sp. NPDC053542]|uniref:protein phosphatase 2C domain-containing protein n=1 Tax=Streptomyces sp. NPDC053542 TaxID=3365710 RepID=UPI0037CF289D
MGLPKTPGEPSEDAAAHDLGLGRVAVADGASRALGSGAWAQCLVHRFVTAPPRGFDPVRLRTWATAAADDWAAGVDLPSDAPPYLVDAVARGSAATLLGILVDPSPAGTNSVWWRAVAIGDTCLFALRNDSVVEAFPLDEPGQFNSTPALIPTAATALAKAFHRPRTTRGACGVGDSLLVMTDALARWTLRRAAQDGGVWRFLSRVERTRFEDTVRTLRDRQEVEADDITFLRCRAVPAPAPGAPGS